MPEDYTAPARQEIQNHVFGQSRIRHKKIISLKMTTSGMKAAAREGLIFGILFCTVIDVVDYFTNDRATLGQLFGAVGMDIAKCLIGAGVAFAMAAGTALAMGTAVVAIGPVAVGLVFAVGASLVLDMIDNQLGLTKKLGRLCDAGLARMRAAAAHIVEEGRQMWQQIEHSAVVRDLSREAGEWSDWIAERSSRVTWKPGFL